MDMEGILEVFRQQAETAEKQQAAVATRFEAFEEQMKEHQRMLSEMVKIMSTGVKPEADGTEPVQRVTGTNHRGEAEMVAKLASRIPKFEFIPEDFRTFPKWYERYGEIITIDGSRLSERTKLRLLLERLDEASYERYASEVKPMSPSEGGYEEAVKRLKALFDVRTSVVTERYKCLNIRKHEREDIGQFTARVNEQCERAKLAELRGEDLKALFWLFGLDSPEDGGIRQRLLAVMEKRHDERAKDENVAALGIQELRAEYEKVRSFQRDSELIEQKPAVVNAVTREVYKDSRKGGGLECFNCGDCGHYSYQCSKDKAQCTGCGGHHLVKYCGRMRKAADRSGRSMA